MSTDMIFDYTVILPSSTRAEVLFCATEAGWSLPHWQMRELRFWQVVEHVNQAMQEQFSLDTTVLRCVRNAYQPDTNCIDRVYELENHSPDWTPPPGSRWINPAELAELPGVTPEHRALLNDWFAAVAGLPTATARVEWARPGWFATATGWIDTALERLGLRRIAPIVQLRAWERSSILRVPTSSGSVYFKAVPPMFRHEIPLSQALAVDDPEQFPAPLAVDIERRWMLTADFGDLSLNKLLDVTRWEAALGRFAALQIAYRDRTAELLALGCPAWPVAELAAAIEPFLAALRAFPADRRGMLSVDDVERVCALGPEITALCAELAGLGIPETLEHGDLWPSNIFTTADQYLFTDWSDSSISHPFFSMILILDEANQLWPNQPEVQERLRDAYLYPWKQAYPEIDVQRAFAIAQRLAPLHQALMYHRHILPQMCARWELQGMLPVYLNMLLRPSVA